ncbi:hsp20/alpha crystallin family domain-containing protein [Phthorimaea operculella]|nr:hsp20/alpha crystallin family domain-containing protein [Phthorimaea operculella]
MFVIRRPDFGDEMLLQSIDWLENFPWRQETGIRTEKDKYEVFLQLKDFEPKDISVKIADGYIVVEAKHEEKKDEHGFISRHVQRKYMLPEECDPEKVQSKLSPDGVLTIVAPRQQVVKKDTVIPVTQENKPKSKL